MSDCPKCNGARAQVEHLTACLAEMTDGRDALKAGLEMARLGHRGTVTAVVATIGGTVEGHPTSSINFLQRLRELVAIEAARSETRRETIEEAERAIIAEHQQVAGIRELAGMDRALKSVRALATPAPKGELFNGYNYPEQPEAPSASTFTYRATPAEEAKREETIDAHLNKCGPLCRHVEFCPGCVDTYGLCSEHRGNPDAGRRWRATPPKEDKL